MAVTSTRNIVNRFSVDLDFYDNRESINEASPGETEIINLLSGANTITPPTGAVACTIIFPATNIDDEDLELTEVLVTLKGVTGDTGIVLHPTEPSSIAINNPASTFVLTAAAALAGVRLIWS